MIEGEGEGTVLTPNPNSQPALIVIGAERTFEAQSLKTSLRRIMSLSVSDGSLPVM